jgi:hypothetical protein
LRLAPPTNECNAKLLLPPYLHLTKVDRDRFPRVAGNASIGCEHQSAIWAVNPVPRDAAEPDMRQTSATCFAADNHEQAEFVRRRNLESRLNRRYCHARVRQSGRRGLLREKKAIATRS